MDYNLLGSSVHGIFLARILEWVVISSFRGYSPPRDRIHVSCIAGRIFAAEPPGKPILLNSYVEFSDMDVTSTLFYFIIKWLFLFWKGNTYMDKFKQFKEVYVMPILSTEIYLTPKMLFDT